MRRKRIQVGWYCNHEAETAERPYTGSHMATHGRYRRGKFQETYPEPNVSKSLSFLDYREPKKRPHCPMAQPVYVLVDRDPASDLSPTTASTREDA